MKIFNVSVKRLPMLIGYGALILSMLACAVLSGSPQQQDSSAQLDNGVIKVKLKTGEWVPVAGKSTFALTGKIESTDPWVVSGKALSTNETTKIDEGLQVGDLVNVQGTILDDNTWLAYSIKRTTDETDPVVVLIGVVDSVDPWVVNGIQLNVTDETEVEGEIKTGTIVRVMILLLDDGTWEVLRISPLGEDSEKKDCATVVATVVSVSGDQIQFLGWPDTVTFAPEDENNNDNENNEEITLHEGDTVSAIVCASDGQLVIVKVTMLDQDEEGNSNNGEKVLICHKPDKKGGHTISVAQAAVPAHLAHGDTLGACP